MKTEKLSRDIRKVEHDKGAHDRAIDELQKLIKRQREIVDQSDKRIKELDDARARALNAIQTAAGDIRRHLDKSLSLGGRLDALREVFEELNKGE